LINVVSVMDQVLDLIKDSATVQITHGMNAMSVMEEEFLKVTVIVIETN